MVKKSRISWYTDYVNWKHLFIPHKDTHQKARLISWEGLLIYVLLFIFLQVGFSILSYIKPGILGISSQIDQEKLIELTNQERESKGLAPVLENEALDKAAHLKARNMFSENYWAHFAPSGKTPWDFILGSGYKFTLAGENLAKNFYNPDQVVKAWMVSPTHRDNLLNPKYQDIGIAVVDGVLNGQKTTLIVQMFGSTQTISAQPIVNVSGKQVAVSRKQYLNAPELLPATTRAESTKTIFDPYRFTKTTSLSLIVLIITLLLLDLIVLSKRGVFRISSRHIAHMALLGVTAAILATSSPGAIL